MHVEVQDLMQMQGHGNIARAFLLKYCTALMALNEKNMLSVNQ